MLKPFLKSTTVYLSSFEQEDITDQYINWLNDAEVCSYNSHSVIPYNKTKANSYFVEITESETTIVFTIRLLSNNKHIGNISLQAINWQHRSAELAILIGEKEEWGKGIASECYKLLINYGFRTLNLNRLYSGQAIENLAMIKVCEKLGMKQEGISRQALFKGGRYIDIVMYSILKSEWKQ